MQIPHGKELCLLQVHQFPKEKNQKYCLTMGEHYTSREGAQLGIPPRSEHDTHRALRAWNSTVHCEIPTDRTGSRIQSQLWKWFVTHASSTAVTHSTCPGPRPDHQGHTLPRCVLTRTMSCPPAPQPDSSGDLQEWRFPRQRSPDRVKLLIFT